MQSPEVFLLAQKQGPIRLGLLLGGDIPLALQSRFGSYADCLVDHLHLSDTGIQVSIWHACRGELPLNVNDADAYVISGSPASVFDEEGWIKALTVFVRHAYTANRRLLGICFGHQVIHHALGGKVERSATGWHLGVNCIPLMKPVLRTKSGKCVSLINMHRDHVVRPAPGFDLLAGGTACSYYMTALKDRILTVQGHPEFTPEFFRVFLSLQADRHHKDEVEKAFANLETANDASELCRLCQRFLLGINIRKSYV